MSDPAAISALRADLAQVAAQLRGAVDRSMVLRAAGPDARHEIDRLWEQFLGDFLAHVKQRGREQGQNLFGGLSFTRIMARG